MEWMFMQLVNWLAVEATETVQLRLIADREVNKSQKQTLPRDFTVTSQPSTLTSFELKSDWLYSKWRLIRF